MATAPSFTFGDTCNAVLNTARSRVDDLILTPAGSPSSITDPGLQLTQVGGATLLAETDGLGNSVPRTQIIFNSAWRKFQKYLSNLGYRFLINYTTITIPANGAADIGSNSWISWNGCFNGTTFAATPQLPIGFIAPLEVVERVTGTNVFFPMVSSLQGLLNIPVRTALNRMWEWRGGAIYLLGATDLTDLKIRFTTMYPDFIPNSPIANLPWYYQAVPIPQALSPLAWYVAYEVLVARVGEQAAAGCLANAQREADLMFNEQARADQRAKTVVDSFPRPGSPPQVAPQGDQ